MQDDSGWLYIGDSTDITPKFRCVLAGHTSGDQNQTAIADPLEANAVLFQQDGHRIIFVQADLLYIGNQVRNNVLKRLSGQVSDSEVFFSASHTHRAPGTDERVSRLGEVRSEYVDQVSESIAVMLQRMLQGSLLPVVLYYGMGKDGNHSVNRRLTRWRLYKQIRFLQKKSSLQPDFNGPCDDRIQTITVYPASEAASTENLQAILWSYSCHPVGFPHATSVSADYPGVVRDVLRRNWNLKIPVVFLQGFSGNIKPNQVDTSRSPRTLIKNLVKNGLSFASFDDATWKTWTLSLAEAVLKSVKQDSVVAPALQTKRSKVPLSTIMNGADTIDVSLQRVLLGNQVNIIAISAEPVVEYQKLIDQLFPGMKNIYIGYIDGVFGYLPTSDMLENKGYEVEDFKKLFSLSGTFHPDINQRVLKILEGVFFS